MANLSTCGVQIKRTKRTPGNKAIPVLSGESTTVQQEWSDSIKYACNQLHNRLSCKIDDVPKKKEYHGA